MTTLLESLDRNAGGVFLVIVLLVAVFAAVQWVVWVAGWGRYRDRKTRDATISYYLGTFVGQIITEFRHFLALVIVLVFATTMFVVIWNGWSDPKNVRDGIQVVAASLGGLIGSIIGYYFGESAGRGAPSQTSGPAAPAAPPPTTQAPPGGAPAAPIPAGRPPGAQSSSGGTP